MEAELSLVVGIIGILLILFITVAGLLLYSGLCAEINIGAGKPPVDDVVIAYRFARGPYKNAGQVFTEVHSLVPELRTIGIYYDDPQEVMSSDLRYVVGAILAEGSEVVNEEQEKLLKGKGFMITTLPATSHAVTTTFPYKNTISIFIAVGRVYPQLCEYIKERSLCAHPMIEIYQDSHILFMAPLAKQDEFYVPEAKEDQNDEMQPELIPVRESASSSAEEKESDSGTEAARPSGISSKPDVIPEKSKESVVEKTSRSGSSTDDSADSSSFEELNLES